ncbi:hypothetical protein HCT46_00720 [Spirochaetales bacterium BR208]|uniref:Acyl CoA:acetate/3-ketoacid CoA transferase n=1 Tax=Entomospira nematocerorum TaxID=2719987 RepID=A0A968GCA6_9SPIO|nr:hypothetical protein [Entomospira nematocera]
MNVQFITSDQAVALINDNEVLTSGGFIGTAVPEELFYALEQRFLQTQKPRNLTLFLPTSQGDAKEKGANHLAHEGLLKCVIAGHWGLMPKLGKMALDNRIEAYNFPQGTIVQAMRAMGAGMDGFLSKTGIGTFIDPREEGGKVNAKTTTNRVDVVNINGDEFLWYNLPKPTFAFLRGTYADRNGNITMKREALTTEMLTQAILTHNAGGTVVVQVERVLDVGEIYPHEVIIPGAFVDYVVEVSDQTMHMQTYGTSFNEDFISPSQQEIMENASIENTLPLDERKIIARRSALMLDKSKRLLNYGIGMPEAIPLVLAEEGAGNQFIPTVEPGIVGGTPAGGLNFGASSRPWAIIDQPYMFDFYDGGGLDVAFLGLAQCDQYGNINVSRFGSKFAGCGGFINISQNAKEIVFCGTFTAGGLKVTVKDGALVILEEGKSKKFLEHVEQITFSGREAVKQGKKTTYITERAVFELTSDGFMLTEIAPGVELQRDIFNQMEFMPLVSENLETMSTAIFQTALMNLTF